MVLLAVNGLLDALEYGFWVLLDLLSRERRQVFFELLRKTFEGLLFLVVLNLEVIARLGRIADDILSFATTDFHFEQHFLRWFERGYGVIPVLCVDLVFG